MSENRLLPCPFCGGEVCVYKPTPHVLDYRHIHGFSVWCPNCDLVFGYNEDWGGVFETEEVAAAAWNTAVTR